MGIEKCVFGKRFILLALYLLFLTVSWDLYSAPSAAHLTFSLNLSSSGSNAHEASQGLLKGAVSAQILAIQGSETGESLEGTVSRKGFSPTGGSLIFYVCTNRKHTKLS